MEQGALNKELIFGTPKTTLFSNLFLKSITLVNKEILPLADFTQLL